MHQNTLNVGDTSAGLITSYLIAVLKTDATAPLIDDSSKPLLHVAVLQQHEAVVDALLKACVNVNQRFLDQTALHVAVNKNNMKLVQLLCEAGADPSMRDAMGQTPLHYAARIGNAAMVTYLQTRFAYIPDNNGVTPMQLAQAHRDPSVVAALQMLPSIGITAPAPITPMPISTSSSSSSYASADSSNGSSSSGSWTPTMWPQSMTSSQQSFSRPIRGFEQ